MPWHSHDSMLSPESNASPYGHSHELHSHTHDHNIDVNSESASENVSTELPHIQYTTPAYDEFTVPNPLHDGPVTSATSDETTTTNTVAETQTETLPSADANNQQLNNEFNSQSSEIHETTQTTSSNDQETNHSTETPTTGGETVVESKNPESVPHREGTATLIEPPSHTGDNSPQRPTETNSELPVTAEAKGLFDNILDTVNTFWSQSKSAEDTATQDFDAALNKLLFPDKKVVHGNQQPGDVNEGEYLKCKFTSRMSHFIASSPRVAS